MDKKSVLNLAQHAPFAEVAELLRTVEYGLTLRRVANPAAVTDAEDDLFIALGKALNAYRASLPTEN